MKRKIVYLMLYPPNNRDLERFGVKIFLQNNWDLEIIVFGKINNPNYFDYLLKNKNILKEKYIKIFNDKLVALKYIEKLTLNKNFFIDLLILNDDFSNCLRNLIKDCYIVKLHNTSAPYPMLRNATDNYFRGFVSIIFNKLIYFKDKYIQNKIDSKFFYLIAGESKNKQLNFKKNRIYTHSFNYDIYLKNSKIQSSNRYITFIDQSFFYTPERLLFNDRIFNFSKVNEKDFFFSINKFLKFMEDKFESRIIILSHHNVENNIKIVKSNYNFEVVLGKSHELIKQSKIVIGQYSFALEFAILEMKPIIFPITKQQTKTIIYNRTKSIAKSLNKNLINIDKDYKNINYTKLIEISEYHYLKYKNNFIKSKLSSDNNGWKTLINYIEKNT